MAFDRNNRNERQTRIESTLREFDGAAPPACPFCRSTTVSTTNKAVTASTYWRCATCGQIWNSNRLQNARPADRWRRG